MRAGESEREWRKELSAYRNLHMEIRVTLGTALFNHGYWILLPSPPLFFIRLPKFREGVTKDGFLYSPERKELLAHCKGDAVKLQLSREKLTLLGTGSFLHSPCN